MTWDDKYWFSPIGLSKNKIGSLMATLSKEAKLSRAYTNHCVRTTVITILDSQGYEPRHIMSVSGHKKVESIQSYTTKTTTAKKRQMSDSLANALCPEPKVFKIPEQEEYRCKPVNITGTDKRPPRPGPSASIPIPQENTFDLSFRDLLELNEEEEKQVLNDIFNNEITYEEPNNKAVAHVSNVQNNVQNVQVNPLTEARMSHLAATVIPKMMFNNSHVTINFNVK